MRGCGKHDSKMKLISGIWQCPECHDGKHKPYFRCDDCGQYFFADYAKRPIPCKFCGSYSTRLVK